jgi:hypothetical protein
LIFSWDPDIVSNLIVHDTQPLPNFSSDHLPTCISFELSRSQHGRVLTSHAIASSFNFLKGDYDAMDNYLLDLDFSIFYNSTDVEFLWESLKDALQIACHLFVPPSGKSTSCRYPKWFHGSIKNKLHKVRSLRKKHRYSNSVTLSQLES